MTAPTLPICEKIARMRDYRADVYGIAADGVDVLLGDCHDTIEALYEALATIDRIVLEQRCERGTPWDLACVTIAEKVREHAATALTLARKGAEE